MSINRTEPEFSNRISKSSGVLSPVAIETHSTVITSLKHLQYTQEAQLSLRVHTINASPTIIGYTKSFRLWAARQSSPALNWLWHEFIAVQRISVPTLSSPLLTFRKPSTWCRWRSTFYFILVTLTRVSHTCRLLCNMSANLITVKFSNTEFLIISPKKLAEIHNSSFLPLTLHATLVAWLGGRVLVLINVFSLQVLTRTVRIMSSYRTWRNQTCTNLYTLKIPRIHFDLGLGTSICMHYEA